MRRLMILLVLLFPSACLAADQGDISATAIPLSSTDPTQDRLGQVRVLGLHRLSAAQSWFGGISGLAWEDDSLVGVTDKGYWLRFNVQADQEGAPLVVSGLQGGVLGGITQDSKVDGDAEEILRDGSSWLVSFERRHRVWRYPSGLDGAPIAVPLAEGVAALGENDGIEAMARLADGRLLLIAEGQEGEPTSPAWIGTPGQWRQLLYPRHGLFRPTAAVALPDGGLLVVERQYTMLAGPAMRLLRLDAGQVEELVGREILRLAPPLNVDNFEAVAVRARADGRLVATLMSDDNFNPLQSTLMLTILLP